MTVRVAELWRYPIKAHGRERIDTVTLTEGQAMPWDRRWAVAHERSCFDLDRPRWQPCQEFTRAASSPRLQAISAWTDPAYRSITLSHPDKVDITINPDDHGDGCEFIQWVMPISNGGRYLPARLVRADEAFTDTSYQSISFINLASHREVERQAGSDLSPARWRGNVLVEGLGAWAEMDWPGKHIRLGTAELYIEEPIGRCRATESNPDTGKRDVDTLKALREGWGHTNCGVYGRVTKSGTMTEGDAIEVLG